jgi:hypothetical protein
MGSIFLVEQFRGQAFFYFYLAAKFSTTNQLLVGSVVIGDREDHGSIPHIYD